jgi:O-antigen/teichoic acid export membrane protein
LDPRPEDDTAHDLRAATLSGVKWTSAARLLAEMGVFASSIVLARLITPAEFGVTVVAIFAAAVGQSLAVQGIGSFLVHHEDPTGDHHEAAILLCLLVGIAGTLAIALVAVTIVPPVFGDRDAELTLLAAPVMLLSSIGAVPIAHLQRRLDFRRLAVVEAGMSLAGPLVAVVLAVAGLEAEALIGGLLAAAAASSLLAVSYARPARPRWRPHEMREIASYGMPAAGSSVLYAVQRNVDYVILAARLPAAQVGYYLRGFQLGSEYQAKVSGILLRVAFPVLSRSRDLHEVRRIRARIIRVHAAVLFPLLFGLIALAPVFVPLAYGEAWEPAVALTQVLAVAGLVSVLGTGTGPLLLATGHPRALLRYNLSALTAYVIGVLIAVPHGLMAVCWTVAGVSAASFLVLQYAVVERVVGIPLVETLRDAVPALVCGLALLATAWAGVHLLDDKVGDLVVLLAAGLASVVVYGVALRALFPATWRDLALLARGLLPG